MKTDKNALGRDSLGTEIKSDLCASDEICLSAFVDREGGWLNSFFAKRILARSFEARKFVDDLERTSAKFGQVFSSEIDADCADVSLWPRISARIAQEERLTLLRSIPLETTPLQGSLSWIARLSWSGFGAVAASLLLLVYLPNQQSRGNFEIASSEAAFSPVVISGSEISNQDNMPIANRKIGVAGFVNQEQDSNFKTVSIDESQAASNFEDSDSWRFLQQSPQFLDSEKTQDLGLSLKNQRRAIAPQVFEVDWMRSNGRVRVLQDSSGKAGIIWVNRPTRTVVASNNNINLTGARSSPMTQSGNIYASGLGNR